MNRNCVFCRIVAGQQHGAFVYQDEQIVAFLDINQTAAGHTLVVPRAHAPYWWDLSDQEAAAIAVVAKPIIQALRQVFDPAGIKINQFNGQAAGQMIFHAHLHLVPVGGIRGPSFMSPPELDQRAARIRAALERIMESE
jgi:histidine triad (HIT) family protein